MTPLISLEKISFWILAASVSARAAHPCPGAGTGDDDWSSLLSETESILDWSEDPLADLDLESPDTYFWSVSMRAGAGHSSNYLKRVDPVGSRYLKLEGDFFLNALFHQSALTSLAFFEATGYQPEVDARSETLAYFHTDWTGFAPAWSYGMELDAFYGDQIYDASLTTTGIPVGANLRQFRPQIGIFGEWGIGSRDTIRPTISISRTWFGDPYNNYWKPQLSLQWTRIWIRSITSKTILKGYSERYDREPARNANGLPRVPEADLKILGVGMEETLTWEPDFWKAFRTTTRFGWENEEESVGDYESSRKYWSSMTATVAWNGFQLQLTGRWQNVRYRSRQVGFLDERPNRQTYRSLKMEAKRTLPWNTSLILRVEWIVYDARKADEVFSDRRGEALLDWSY